MSSAVTNISYAQNFTFLESPSEIQTKIICDTDESDWSSLYETCKTIKTVMDQSNRLLLETRKEQRKVLNDYLNVWIELIFSQNSSQVAFPVPSPDLINTVLIPFQKCRSPEVKMEAFCDVLQATNSTDDIARQFYKALPEGKIGKLDASRTLLRHYIWLVNSQSDNGLSLGFSEHAIATAPRSFLAIHAAQCLCSKLYEKKIEDALNAISNRLHPESN
jgi:hypothetical protein